MLHTVQNLRLFAKKNYVPLEPYSLLQLCRESLLFAWNRKTEMGVALSVPYVLSGWTIAAVCVDEQCLPGWLSSTLLVLCAQTGLQPWR